MYFKDREEAAELLAKRLIQYQGQNPLILAIPRGAVPMAKIIAEALDGEVDVVLVHKLGAPENPEFAVGAVDEFGHVYTVGLANTIGFPDRYIAAEKERQLKTLRDRRARYTPIHPPIDPSGRIVIVVDDGIATGASMLAALQSVRVKSPRKLIAATAVAPAQTLQAVQAFADEVVCLHAPEDFYAVGEFFREFPQVSDEEVLFLLQEDRSKSKKEKTSREVLS